MKLGILTCHDVFNFGATLQAYGLSFFLNKNGIKSEIINYKPPYLYKLIDFMEVDTPKWNTSALRRWVYRLYMVPAKVSRVKKYCRFKRFNKKYLPLSKEKYQTLEELQKKADYSICICGSDQIWNSVQYECGKDPTFYLSFMKNGRKISYAASFGSAEASKEGEANIQEYLPCFDYISVRESSGVNLLKSFGLQARHVVDPVFLLDAGEWRTLMPKKLSLPKNYLLVYGYDNDPSMEEAVNGYVQQKNCAVISAQKSKAFRNAGPREFLALIDNAEMIITSSFHAVAFSILLHKPFVAVPTGNAELFERLADLLKTAGLEDRYWVNLCNTVGWQSKEIDYQTVGHRIAPIIEESKEFLMTAVSGE